jgi:hypothetical protein
VSVARAWCSLTLVACVLMTATAGRAQDDDLGSQPLEVPSSADLGGGVVADEGEVGGSVPSVGAPGTEAPATRVTRSLPLPPGVTVTSALTAALHDLDDTNPKALLKRLEDAAALWESTPSPSWRPLQRLAKARIALWHDHFDEADAHLRDADAALDVAALEGRDARRLREAVRFFRAQLAEGRARGVLLKSGCGPRLGLRRLARDEAEEREAIVTELTSKYRAVVEGRDRFWSRRAAFAAALLSEALARRALGEDDAEPPSFRAVALPPPYALDAVEARSLVEPTLGAWLGSLRRTYGEIIADINAIDPDPALVERVRRQAAALANVEIGAVAEAIKNPWHDDVHPGLVRVARRAESADASGRFAPIESAVAIDHMTTVLAQQGVVTVDGALALTGLSLLQPDSVPTTSVVAALSSSDTRVVVAGLIAAERTVKGKRGVERAKALLEPVVVATARALGARAKTRPPFSNVRDSLYEPVERGLLALLSIARADRTLLDVIAVDARLPLVERAWLAAEVADARLAERYDAWGWDKDERVAALAVWGSVTSRGRRFAGYLLRPGEPGLVGCVSRALAH